MDQVLGLYDRAMYRPRTLDFYGGSDFYNFGYWTDGVRNAKEASEKLVDTLVDLIPDRSGNVLDIACGKGATTKHLLNYYDPDDVVGINISPKQLVSSIHNAPSCSFLTMDAATLGFADESFSNIVCVEAVFHFRTRQNFLREAYRILKPGGTMVLSDILYTRWAHDRDKLVPAANYVADIGAYRAMFEDAGFAPPTVTDATEESWRRFRRQLLRNALTEWHVPLFFLIAPVFTRSYLLVAARKPD